MALQIRNIGYGSLCVITLLVYINTQGVTVCEMFVMLAETKLGACQRNQTHNNNNNNNNNNTK
jgi:hypothetical protein